MIVEADDDAIEAGGVGTAAIVGEGGQAETVLTTVGKGALVMIAG